MGELRSLVTDFLSRAPPRMSANKASRPPPELLVDGLLNPNDGGGGGPPMGGGGGGGTDIARVEGSNNETNKV